MKKIAIELLFPTLTIGNILTAWSPIYNFVFERIHDQCVAINYKLFFIVFSKTDLMLWKTESLSVTAASGCLYLSCNTCNVFGTSRLVRSCGRCLSVWTAAIRRGRARVGHSVCNRAWGFTVDARPVHGAVTFVWGSFGDANSSMFTRARVTAVFVLTSHPCPSRNART